MVSFEPTGTRFILSGLPGMYEIPRPPSLLVCPYPLLAPGLGVRNATILSGVVNPSEDDCLRKAGRGCRTKSGSL